MTVLRRIALAAALLGALTAGPAAAAQPREPPKQLDEFVPIDQLPQEEQIPAAALLIPAYAFVWVAVFAYVISVAKRLGTVQREVDRLESDLKAGKRP